MGLRFQRHIARKRSAAALVPLLYIRKNSSSTVLNVFGTLVVSGLVRGEGPGGVGPQTGRIYFISRWPVVLGGAPPSTTGHLDMFF